MGLPYFKLHCWPGLTFGLYIFTFLLTYLISVALNRHVYGFFPYISDTGTKPPESCIFGQMMNFGALSLGITLYIRYRQVDFGINSGHIDVRKKWNTVALWLSIIMSLGTSIVANFQETAILTVHILGAYMVFGIGTAYFFIQTRISLASTRKLNYTNPNYGIGRNMLYLRIFLSFSLFPLLFINSICGLIALNKFTGKNVIWWTEEDGGFQVRLASTFSEWILVIFLLSYIVTFTSEFKSLKFEEFRFAYKNRDLSEPQETSQQIAKV